MLNKDILVKTKYNILDIRGFNFAVLNNICYFFYGGVLPDEYNTVWIGEKDWTDTIAQKNKLYKPDRQKLLKEYYRKKNEIIKNLGVRVETIGNDEYIKYIVGVNESFSIADGTYTEQIYDMKCEDNWNIKIINFCKLLDIPVITSKWCIASYCYVKE